MGLLPLSLFGAKKNKMVDFNYPQDVSKTALTDLDKALKGGDGRLVVVAIVRYSIAQSGISHDNMPDIVSRIDSAIQLEKRRDCPRRLHGVGLCNVSQQDLPIDRPDIKPARRTQAPPYHRV